MAALVAFFFMLGFIHGSDFHAPYLVPYNNRLAALAHLVLFLVFLAAHLIQSEYLESTQLDDTVQGLLLAAVMILLLVATGRMMYLRHREQRRVVGRAAWLGRRLHSLLPCPRT